MSGDFMGSRNVVFISKATPGDDEFVLWLAPRLTPNPLFISVLRSSNLMPPLEDVLNDIMGLTKINYNACNFNDGLPVTVRFADKVGDVLSMGSAKGAEKQPFKFYV